QETRSRRYAAVAAIVLIGTPFFISDGASQEADLPLSFFMLAAFGLIWLHELNEVQRRRLLILAGFFAGLAAWTKNEGMLFLLALACAYGSVTYKSGIRNTARGVAWIGLGALPALITIAYFKSSMAPPDVLLRGQTIDGILSKAFDID